MRTQKVIIYKFDGISFKEKIPFEGDIEQLKMKLNCLQLDAARDLKKKHTIAHITENKEKYKKLGMGLNIIIDDNKTDIFHQVFWPVKLEKPKLI